MSDLDAYGSVIDGLREQAKECKVSLLLIPREFILNLLNIFAHQPQIRWFSSNIAHSINLLTYLDIVA